MNLLMKTHRHQLKKYATDASTVMTVMAADFTDVSTSVDTSVKTDASADASVQKEK